jgi:phospholipase/carboxylesterase
VLFHGFGAPGDDLVSLHNALHAPSGTRYCFPEGRLSLGPMYQGGRAWWPVDMEARMRRLERGEGPDPDQEPAGIDAARAQGLELLDVLSREHASDIVLGGFSQGSMLALDLALRAPAAFAPRALLLLSSTLICRPSWTEKAPRLAGTPVLLSHGEQDAVLPFSMALALRDLLQTAGCAVSWVPFRGGHAIPEPVLIGMQRVLSALPHAGAAHG